MTSLFRILIALLAWLCLSAFSWAQTGSPSPAAKSGELPSLEVLQSRLETVREQLRKAPAPIESTSQGDGEMPPPMQSSLLRIETSLRRLISLREGEALLRSQQERLDQETSQLIQHGLEERPPYPITLLDDLQHQLSRAEDDLTSSRNSLASAQANAKVQDRQLAERQALRRRWLDRAAQASNLDIDRDRLIEDATMAVQAAEAALEVAQAEVSHAKKAGHLAEKRRDLIVRKVELVKAQFQFSRSALNEQLQRLDDERQALTQAHSQAQSETDQALARLQALPETASPSELEEARRAALSEWLTTYQRKKLLTEQALELNLAKRDLWERRFALSQGQAVTNLSDWEETTRGLLRRLEAEKKSLENQLAQLRGRLADLVDATPPEDRALEAQRVQQARALTAHQTALETTLTDYEKVEHLAQRLLSEIASQRSTLSLEQRAARAWSVMVDVWRIELYTIGDNSVTVGKVVIAFLVLVIGLTLAGRATALLSRRLLAHLPLPDTTRSNIERGLRYLVILLVFLFSLRVVNIPLTIFTFLGGTLAIAVGFGAQNILNNFISGLILMAERPVRVGDLVEVSQTTGVIEEIGARSTRLRLATGIHVVFPNSVLLENKVVNWTLTDQQVRTSVAVGVAYGSDPRLVTETIRRATLSIDTIEKTPEPFIVLENLGDSGLLFEVHFWVSMVDPLNKRMSESALRIALLDHLQEQGISIPFPHRSLSLSEPIQVQLTPAPSDSDPS